MQVLITCGLVFILGFWSGTMMVATSLILTERDTEPARIRAPESKMFPSYQRYLSERGVS